MNVTATAVSTASLELGSLVTHDTRIVRYMTYGAFTALIWDWLLSVAEEVRLVRRFSVSIALFAYFVARITIAGLCILIIVFQTTALPNCQPLFIAMAVCTITGTAANSFLFLLRVCAVYSSSGNSSLCGKSKGERLVALIFGVWWVVVVGTTVIYSFGVGAEHQGATLMCGVTSAEDWSTASLWVNAGYDTCIFVAISARIASYAIQPSHYNTKSTSREGWRAFMKGDGLSHLCKELLRGGQLFYFVTIGFTLLGSIMPFAPVKPILKVGFMTPALAIETIMTSRVFRGVALSGTNAECEEASKLQAMAVPEFTSVGVFSRPEVEAETRAETQTTTQGAGSGCETGNWEPETVELEDAHSILPTHRGSMTIHEVDLDMV